MSISKIEWPILAALVISGVCLLAQAGSAFAAEVTNKITCEKPTKRTDGTDVSPTEIVKVTAYASRCDGATAVIESEVCSIIDTFTMPAPRCNVGYQLTATDVDGIESARSEIVYVEDVVQSLDHPQKITVKQITGSMTVEFEVSQ